MNTKCMELLQWLVNEVILYYFLVIKWLSMKVSQ